VKSGAKRCGIKIFTLENRINWATTAIPLFGEITGSPREGIRFGVLRAWPIHNLEIVLRKF
jgi:hypothetical protein